jgi:dipeptidyl-peptidase-3
MSQKYRPDCLKDCGVSGCLCLAPRIISATFESIKTTTMKYFPFKWAIALLAMAIVSTSCSSGPDTDNAVEQVDTLASGDDFQYLTEQFEDVKILRYRIPAWDKLPLDQKMLAYYLAQAGLSCRDIIYDQNYRHNLEIRRTLEHIYTNFNGDKETLDWKAFETYLKRIWFANGIHHHYSGDKFEPGFSSTYFRELLNGTSKTLSDEATRAIFEPGFDNKRTSKDADDLIMASAVNFYSPNLTQKEVEGYFKAKRKGLNAERPISLGLNSRLVKDETGKIYEDVYKVGGLYGEALEQSIGWLEKAITVAGNPQQKEALQLLVEYYRTGDLTTWDAYNIAWVKDASPTVDYIQGFIEVYQDPLGYTGNYESIVQVRDLDASEKMKVLAENAQYFEDKSITLPEHKKDTVVGITYNFINVVSESGDASPSTPVGVNLPNANWIRAAHGSKSVSLGNIVEAYDKGGTAGFNREFCHDTTEIVLSRKHGRQAGKLHTALHEVIGHASGKINEGVGTPKESLKNFGSTIEEARADLVALYFIMDPKLIEIGVMDHMDVAHCQYDDYLRNGLMLQLRRIKPGDKIEQDHMRNRQTIATWAFEMGANDKVIEMVKHDGKTYFNINDYEKLREIFGAQLREVQRITSEGDYEAAKALVEKYGVQVNQEIHAEVLARSEQFQSAPYGGFINPRLVAVEADGKITSVEVEYPDDFSNQMLEYASKYSFLPE